MIHRSHTINDLRSYHDCVEFIESLSMMKRTSSYGAEAHPRLTRRRMSAFLALLDNPHSGFKVVHVTGTSGKGSTTMMIGNMLQAAGKRAGIYTSPHTTTTIERFTGPDGRLMSSREFVRIVSMLRPVLHRMDTIPEGLPSYLEIMVAIAFLFFRSQRCEWIVLEVGMGGLRDATNVIAPPRVAVITPIDLDHAHLIGPSLSNIAREKSGIIKRTTHVFTNEQRPALRRIIQERCRSVGAHWHPSVAIDPSAKPPMAGQHQYKNASLAIAVGEFLGISQTSMEQALATTKLPCRWETAANNPTIILDGAHNPLAIRAVATTFSSVARNRRILIVGFSEHKDAETMLKTLPAARLLILVRFVGSRACQSPGSLMRILRRTGRARRYRAIRTTLTSAEALAIATNSARPRDTILITGSLYLTGELRKHWILETSILQYRTSFPPTN